MGILQRDAQRRDKLEQYKRIARRRESLQRDLAHWEKNFIYKYLPRERTAFLAPVCSLQLALDVLQRLAAIPGTGLVPAHLTNQILITAGGQGREPQEIMFRIANTMRFEHVTKPLNDRVMFGRLAQLAWNKGDTPVADAGPLLLYPVKEKNQADDIAWSTVRDRETAKYVYERALSMRSAQAEVAWGYWIRNTFRNISRTRASNEAKWLRGEFPQVVERLETTYDSLRSNYIKRTTALLLAKAYAEAELIPRKGDKVKYWLERGVQADSESCAYMLGSIYLGLQYHGFGLEPLFERDVDKGLAIYEKIKFRHRWVPYMLGRIYYDDPLANYPDQRSIQSLGVPPSDRHAAENFFLGICLQPHMSSYRIKFAEMLMAGRAHPPADDHSTPMTFWRSAINPVPAIRQEIEKHGAVFAPRSHLETLQYAFSLVEHFWSKKMTWSTRIPLESSVRRLQESLQIARAQESHYSASSTQGD